MWKWIIVYGAAAIADRGPRHHARRREEEVATEERLERDELEDVGGLPDQERPPIDDRALHERVGLEEVGAPRDQQQDREHQGEEAEVDREVPADARRG